MRRFFCTGLLLGALLSSGSARAGLFGANVLGENRFPILSVLVLAVGPAIIDPTTAFQFPAMTATVTFTNTTIIVTNNDEGSYTLATFNGFVFTIVNGDPVSGASLNLPASNNLFENGVTVTFDATHIYVNLANSCVGCQGGESIVINVETGAGAGVPEPASLILLGVGLAGFGLARRDRRPRH